MSELFDDTNHPVSFESPLGSKLVVQSMSGDEALGGLFNYNLELLSQDFELHFDQVVGQQVTVALELPEGKRHFNAFITEFRYLGHSDRYARYQATLRPWLWFLTRTSDCKIFQEKKVPDIIKEVFRENGMSHFEDRLTGNYREWEYCVQYRETDFNFISRLMEQEGIYYYFEHSEDKHTLILTDDMGTHKPFPKFETIPYCPPTGQMSVQEDDHLQHWAVTQSIQPEQYAIQDFDFKKPRVDMLSRFNLPGNHDYPGGDPEIFDYPGEYVETDDGMHYVEIRLQELRGQFEKVNAGGPCRGMSAGCLFTLEDYPREDQNKEYLVLAVSHQINDTSYISSGGGSSEELYRCAAFVMDSVIPYRQVRSTPKPIVQGPQTAIVVGPSGEEIYTDEFGRVKVQFHWDRYGKDDENSSCWIRVSQLWAGTKWGGMHIPRIGQEVIVSFMEGDPDKPVITGRVYNAECMPPYTLEQSKTQSGIKSRSSKGGGPDNFNEIRMEDKKGSEELYIQAEKNENILVKNNKGETVGNNETISIGNDREETVGHNETITVGNDRVEMV
ncbi:MAG: type VI secretion system Vgr family protein, partial [Xanthomonadales bacterium]|nr:type VI secretion system Vgr family protein [Xanthomonadales bacterium]